MELNYRVFGDVGEDVIILHGLLGSLDNFQTVARELSSVYRVWIVDQRNHGSSPHTKEMDYGLMAGDIKVFMDQQNIAHAHIVGHSMGGKVAMSFALKYPEITDHLIVIDIGPKPYEGDHLPYIEAMLATDVSKYKMRKDVEVKIKELIPSPWVVQVIMKNLGRDEHKEFVWKPNLQLLHDVYQDIMGSSLGDRTYSGKTDFIKGAESDYIQEDDFDAYKEHFPKAQLHIVADAGHMVHINQPEAFYNLLLKLLGE